MEVCILREMVSVVCFKFPRWYQAGQPLSLSHSSQPKWLYWFSKHLELAWLKKCFTFRLVGYAFLEDGFFIKSLKSFDIVGVLSESVSPCVVVHIWPVRNEMYYFAVLRVMWSLRHGLCSSEKENSRLKESEVVPKVNILNW